MNSKNLLEKMLSNSDQLLSQYDALENQLLSSSQDLRSFLVESSFSSFRYTFEESAVATKAAKAETEFALENSWPNLKSFAGSYRNLEDGVDSFISGAPDVSNFPGVIGVEVEGRSNKRVDKKKEKEKEQRNDNSCPREQRSTETRCPVSYNKANNRCHVSADRNTMPMTSNTKEHLHFENLTDSDGFKRPFLPPKRTTTNKTSDYILARFIDSLADDQNMSERASSPRDAPDDNDSDDDRVDHSPDSAEDGRDDGDAVGEDDVAVAADSIIVDSARGEEIGVRLEEEEENDEVSMVLDLSFPKSRK